jgi:NAD(P)-dependent dehydrogenase (short-subunit alcohol dehydrogenase family)
MSLSSLPLFRPWSDRSADPSHPTQVEAILMSNPQPPAQHSAQPSARHSPQHSVRSVLVTGATSGLGRAVARALSAQGLRVLVHGRDPERTRELAAELDRTGAAGARPLVADLASLAGVRELAVQAQEQEGALHVLVNNAGLGAGPPPHTQREVSADGHELRFAVNYLAPVLLTRLLLPLLVRSAAGPGTEPSRVVNVGSVGQGPPDVGDLGMTRGYTGEQAYVRSKFALAAFTVDLGGSPVARDVRVNCLHPATYMDTRAVREAGITPWAPVAAGVPPVLALATGAAGGEVTGGYFDGLRPSRAHRGVYDAATRARLAAATDAMLAPFARAIGPVPPSAADGGRPA